MPVLNEIILMVLRFPGASSGDCCRASTRTGRLTLLGDRLFSPAAMAEKKAEKSPKKPPAAKAASEKASPEKAAAPKAAKAPKGDVSARSKATPAAAEGERCSVEKCAQPVRAKGLCRKHFMAWRRGADVGVAHRYKVCSKEGCRKPRMYGGLCDEHAGKAAPAGDAPAPAAA